MTVCPGGKELQNVAALRAVRVGVGRLVRVGRVESSSRVGVSEPWLTLESRFAGVAVRAPQSVRSYQNCRIPTQNQPEISLLGSIFIPTLRKQILQPQISSKLTLCQPSL